MKKYCVISGGSKGIGFAIARRLAAEGYHLALIARTKLDLENASTSIRNQYPNVEVITRQLDVTSKDSLSDFADMLASRWSHIDVLVNNAGTFTPGGVLDEEDGALEHMFMTNCFSAYYLTRYLFPLIEKSPMGHIFNMCSIASIAAYPSGGSYSISKFALYGFSKNLREELKPRGVRVTSILPGATWTDSWSESGVEPSRIMEANDIAEAVVSALKMSPNTVVEDIVLRPQLGDL
jgi:short-subunit dehydrogenase